MTTLDFPPKEVRRRRNRINRQGLYFAMAIVVASFVVGVIEVGFADFSVRKAIYVTAPLATLFILFRQLPRYSDKKNV